MDPNRKRKWYVFQKTLEGHYFAVIQFTYTFVQLYSKAADFTEQFARFSLNHCRVAPIGRLYLQKIRTPSDSVT